MNNPKLRRIIEQMYRKKGSVAKFGNAGRNIIRGPGVVNVDAALHREFPIREGMQLALRVESFNFSNTPHYNNPNFNINSPQFGEINSAMQDQRQYQIGLTLRF